MKTFPFPHRQKKKELQIKKELELRGHQINIPYFTQKIIEGEASYEEYIKSKERDGGDILLRRTQNIDFIKEAFKKFKGSKEFKDYNSLNLTPNKFRPLETLKSAKSITITPAVLKNNLEDPPLTTDVRPPTPKRPGVVPNAKTPKVRAP